MGSGRGAGSETVRDAMVTGFNHTVTCRGEQFHVQTEDSGREHPHIVTLLYRGGVIIASQKTSYADILKMEKLDENIGDLMKEQHKQMMHRLKGGEFDEKIRLCCGREWD